MSNTRQTHPWVDTKLRRVMRQKQRVHWRAKKRETLEKVQRFTEESTEYFQANTKDIPVRTLTKIQGASGPTSKAENKKMRGCHL